MPLLSGATIRTGNTATQSHGRHKNSTKPSFVVVPPHFYLCGYCQRLLIDPMIIRSTSSPTCCGVPMTLLTVQNADTEHLLHMTVSGGFERNSLTINIGEPAHPMQPEHHISWIYLYSFQGGQLKCLAPDDSSTVTFALAEKDAYVYCDRAICKGSHCKFNCKRGFSVWAYCNQHGLFYNCF